MKALCIIFNIDERKQAMDDLKIRAERDALTGLYNRKETENRSGRIWRKNRKISAPFS